MIPDPSGQLAELIVYITSTRVDLYSHQIQGLVMQIWISELGQHWSVNSLALTGAKPLP